MEETETPKMSGWDVPPPDRRIGPTRWDVPPKTTVKNPPVSLLEMYGNPQSYFYQRRDPSNPSNPNPSNPLALVGDSTRNIQAIHTLETATAVNIRYFFFTGGHSSMTTPSGAPVEPISPNCPSVFFNYPGEVSSTYYPNRQIFQLFQHYIMTQFNRPINGIEFLLTADYAKQGFAQGTPLSVYLPQNHDVLPNLVLFAPGSLMPSEIGHSTSGVIVLQNPACFFVYDIQTNVVHDLGRALFQDNFPIMTVQPGNETNVYSYLRRDNGSPVTLRDIYHIINVFIGHVGGTLDQAALACISCRCSSDIVINRIRSITKPGQPPAQYRPGGSRKKKKQRKMRKNRRTTRNSKKC